MKLGQFIKEFIDDNSLVRLLYENMDGGHILVHSNTSIVKDNPWDLVSMEHEILNSRGINRHYINNEVIGITSVLTSGNYSESINIVIEKLDNQPLVQEIPRNISYHSESI